MKPGLSNRFLGLVATLVLLAVPVRAGEISAAVVGARLDSVKTNIAAELTAQLGTNVIQGSYTTVWRQFEDLAIVALKDILPRHLPELGPANFAGGKAGSEKNRLADFAIVCGTNTIEISIKTARNSGQPENDLGTFRDHENRKKLFAAAFTLMVRYQDDAGTIRAEQVFFDRSWRFVGKSTLVDGVKYRKKDGNMRPQSWTLIESGRSPWATEADFEAAVKRSEIYRANTLVQEYLNDLSEEDQKVLHDRLHEKFVTPDHP